MKIYGLENQQTSLFCVFILVYGNLCTFTVSEHFTFHDNEINIQIENAETNRN